MSETSRPGEDHARRLASRIAKAFVLAPVTLYRWTLSPLLGVNCRHLPNCSDYASEAIAKNGAWRGAWLALSRLLRCHPWGSQGFDPVPDVSAERHAFAPWRYGRWTLARPAGDDIEAKPGEKAAPYSNLLPAPVRRSERRQK
jgi:uncharacterized protein